MVLQSDLAIIAMQLIKYLPYVIISGGLGFWEIKSLFLNRFILKHFLR